MDTQKKFWSKPSGTYTLSLGFVLLLALAVLSQVYWQERVLFSDSAFQVFTIFVKGEFAIQVQRFGAAFVQSFPLLSMKLGGDLATSLRLYSLAFTLYPIIIFLLLVFVVKNRTLALVVVLYYGLAQTHSFFWMQNELVQANVFAILLLGIVDGVKTNWKWWQWLTVSALWVVVIYTHPLGVFALLAGTVYIFLVNEQFGLTRLLSLVLLTVAILFYKHFLVTTGGYDDQAIGLFAGFEERIWKIGSLDSTRFFRGRLVSTYYLLLGVFLLVLGYYASKRRWLRFSWILLSIVGWLVLILTTYHWPPTSFYIESYYLTLAFLLGLPICYEILPKVKRQEMAWLFLLTVLIVRITQIVDASPHYTARTDWLHDQLDTMRTYPEQRFLISKHRVPQYLLHYDWGVCYETLMLSALDGKEQKTLYVFDDSKDPEVLAQQKNKIATPFDYLNEYYTLQKSAYFSIHDTLPARILVPQ